MLRLFPATPEAQNAEIQLLVEAPRGYLFLPQNRRKINGKRPSPKPAQFKVEEIKNGPRCGRNKRNAPPSPNSMLRKTKTEQ